MSKKDSSRSCPQQTGVDHVQEGKETNETDIPVVACLVFSIKVLLRI